MPKLTCHVSRSLHQALEEQSKVRGESVSHMVREALARYLGVQFHTLFQVSTTGALVRGIYERAVSTKVLINYGDFGLGTFENLDGEMVMLDGIVYQATSDGKVHVVSDDVGTPFATVLHFASDQDHIIGKVTSLEELVKLCDRFRDSDNIFYAFRIDGRFAHIHTRTMSATHEGIPLAQAAATQPEFDFKDVEGTLVGIWAPQFASGFNVAGYHFHFLSTDRTMGGHLLDCSAHSLRIRMERMNDFHLSLPESEGFLRADLSGDTTKDLAYAEQIHSKEQTDDHTNKK
jgi:acetolactate decarboxylase